MQDLADDISEYDEALKKVGVMFDELKEKAKTLGDDYQERLAELE